MDVWKEEATPIKSRDPQELKKKHGKFLTRETTTTTIRGITTTTSAGHCRSLQLSTWGCLKMAYPKI